MIPQATRLVTVCLLACALTFDVGWCSKYPSPVAPILSRELPYHYRSPMVTALPGDERWWDGFGLPTTDGYVKCAIEFQGSIIVAGHFSRIGDVRANNIARWDGNDWVPLGTGIEWGSVGSLTIHGGDLVAAGFFSFAGGVLARSIARWNGFEWSAFGAGI